MTLMRRSKRTHMMAKKDERLLNNVSVEVEQMPIAAWVMIYTVKYVNK